MAQRLLGIHPVVQQRISIYTKSIIASVVLAIMIPTISRTVEVLGAARPRSLADARCDPLGDDPRSSVALRSPGHHLSPPQASGRALGGAIAVALSLRSFPDRWRITRPAETPSRPAYR